MIMLYVLVLANYNLSGVTHSFNINMCVHVINALLSQIAHSMGVEYKTGRSRRKFLAMRTNMADKF